MNRISIFGMSKQGKVMFGLIVLIASCSITSCGGGGHNDETSSAVPAVASISPATGPLPGGVQVTLTGSGFTKATQVTFGTTAGLNLKIVSDSTLTVFTTAGTGAVDVRVSTPAGQSPVVDADRFTFQSSPGQYAFNYAITSPANAEVRGLAVDSVGNLYIAYQGINQVEKFDPFGNLVSTIGSLRSGPGQISGPNGLAVDATDNLYVADGFRIVKFDRMEAFQSEIVIASTNYYPRAVALDLSGNIYAGEADQTVLHGRIEKFDSTGKLLQTILLPGAPSGIAADASNNILSSILPGSDGSLQLVKFDSTGNQVSQSPSDGGAGIALDSSGNLYVPKGVQVTKFDGKGSQITQFGSAGTGNGQFRAAGVITVSANGNVYVLDHVPGDDFNQPSRVEIFTPL